MTYIELRQMWGSYISFMKTWNLPEDGSSKFIRNVGKLYEHPSQNVFLDTNNRSMLERKGETNEGDRGKIRLAAKAD